MSLDDLRKKIDETDAEIIRLLAERIRNAEAIGREKQKQGEHVENLSREEEVLANVRRLADQAGISVEGTESIFRRIVNVSKSAEGLTVAFQGELGAYSEEAAVDYFGPAIEVKPCESLDAVFDSVEREAAHFGVVPIENSLEGSISRVYDLLLESSVKVRGEIELRVTHCLIANPGARLDLMTKIYSHPQALGQCRAFLKHLDCELVPTYDTAGSVKMIKEQGITDGAAIAGVRAAEIYGMTILAHEIEDNPNNFTRFFVLAKHDSPPTGHDKTSIVFAVSHKPGSLYSLLRELAASQVNLTKIESRPTRQRPWEYNFYLDFDGHRDDTASREALGKLEQTSLFVKVLGSYPKASE
ncbi:MAG: prephenate dehydratase [Dehalococcoidales bacterium]|nr:MAG: prephenate dehydratase [Dehalococcoidales bacterium]